MSSNESVVREFIDITGVSPTVARQMLESANGNLEVAINLFYNDQSSFQPAPHPAPSPRPAPTPKPTPRPAPQPTQPNQDSRQIIDDIFHHANHQQTQPEDPPNTKVDKVKVTFWKNGFQVNDGELRLNEDPANHEFLQSISRGVIPRELYKPGSEVDVEIEDNREKNYVEKPKPKDPWSGTAHKLNDGPSAPTQQVSNAPLKPTKTNYADPDLPSTKVRIQLPNGIIVLSVNMNATVGDLKRYVIENDPQLRGKRLQLSVQFPPRVLSEDFKTVAEENLKMTQLKLTVL
ncbi:NSFL1 cofactor p47 isoform X3 [Histomonas meleagridis]|uniref:NSFL1 cofactor p47 isoform X3 n=1 Tax=Histomonas meleagridis TaxID=135588 RepID=UPI00355A45D4|nr:NSFL1 cofactor p47 isoform X3 [Histomonas meleagridis]KAH0799919.1 NSFL1 cofactor p47 isoform X3 [Histomonas meleagridis]